MFGYVNPDKPHMFLKDEVLYNALYCGVCKSIGKSCGCAARSALTYDSAFMSALVHNLCNRDVKITKKRCFLHWIKRRPIAETDEITLLIACANTALAYYKLLDDKRDGDKKGLLAFLYKRGFKRVIKKHPQLAVLVKDYIDGQNALEEEGCAVIDAACEPSANMLKELSRLLLGGYATADTDALFYDVGKWVYLADALDDYDKDVKKGNYNVFHRAYGQDCKQKAVEANAQEINFIFNTLFGDMRARMASVKLYFNHDLVDNIIYMGIPKTTRRLVYGKCGEGKKKDE